MSKLKLVIPSWPNQAIDLGYYSADNTATHIRLRMINPADKWDSSPKSRAVTDLSLYVWVNIEGTVSIKLWASEIRSAEIRDLELRLKLLKRLTAKAEKAGFHFNCFNRESSVYDQIVRSLDALGIRQAVEYHRSGQPETFAPVAIAARRIADAVDSRLTEQRLRKAA